MTSISEFTTPDTSIESVFEEDHVSTDIFTGYDHVTWYVSNAKQAASFYCSRFGFKEIAYRGLETGSKDICSHVIRKNDITFIFTSALRAKALLPENAKLVEEIHNHVTSHGDAVKDIAFRVNDAVTVFYAALKNGIESVHAPKILSDSNGEVTIATIKAVGDTTHTLVERSRYNSQMFLPGYVSPQKMEPYIDSYLGDTGVYVVDHCVGNQGWNEMAAACEYYEKALGFHKFWSVDDKQIHTEFSALRSTVMASSNNLIKMPINEPAEGKKHSQIEEFVDFNNGPGIQHLALRTNDIIDTITKMRQRGVEFIQIPPAYYDNLRERLKHSKVKIHEDISVIQDLDILVDFDDSGYLLQLFTKPLSDRPTLFIEIIQRENFEGFGAGNFKSLFESIEQDQMIRGTL